MRPVHRLLAIVYLSFGASAAYAAEDTWSGLKGDVFGQTPIAENSPYVSLAAPTRAEDAALVPIDVRLALPEGDPRTIEEVTLIVDENPAPVAATFRFGRDRREASLSTRLRVNSYSNVRAVMKTSDGGLHMTARFVKASGGCSAPAMKDADQALANLGQVRLKRFPDMTPAPEAQIMVRHPNYSGLQMDQVTRLYIPAKFVRHIVVTQKDELVFEMEGGISLSEDPTIRFSYKEMGGDFSARAEDTDGGVFSGRFAPSGS